MTRAPLGHLELVAHVAEIGIGDTSRARRRVGLARRCHRASDGIERGTELLLIDGADIEGTGRGVDGAGVARPSRVGSAEDEVGTSLRDVGGELVAGALAGHLVMHVPSAAHIGARPSHRGPIAACAAGARLAGRADTPVFARAAVRDRRADRRIARARPARLDLTGGVTAVAGHGVPVVAGAALGHGPAEDGRTGRDGRAEAAVEQVAARRDPAADARRVRARRGGAVRGERRPGRHRPRDAKP